MVHSKKAKNYGKNQTKKIPTKGGGRSAPRKIPSKGANKLHKDEEVPKKETKTKERRKKIPMKSAW